MYLEIDEGFVTHRKTLRFCALMQSHNAFAFVLRLWSWACRSAPDGDLTGMEAADIEFAIQYTNTNGNGKCYEALVAAGFIDADESGAPIRLHNWMLRTGGAIRKMSDEARRKKTWRDAHKDVKCTGKGRCQICAGLSADSPKTGDRTSDTDKTSQDQSSPDLDLPSAPAGDPGTTEPVPQPGAPGGARSKLWTAGEWLSQFSRAWTGKYHLTYGGGTTTAKACGAFSDVLAALPEAERFDAQARAPSLIAAYFADPTGNAARHPFHWFVDRFDGLRVKQRPSAQRCWFHEKSGTNGKPNPRGPDGNCVECRHVTAGRGDRSSEPAGAGSVLPKFVPPPAWTPEQKAEAEALRRGEVDQPRAATGGSP